MSSVIWVKVMSAGFESATFVECDPSTTFIARLKKLVKAECSPKFDYIAALDLVVRGADGAMIEEDTLLSEREEGRSKARAFIVEIPAAAGEPAILPPYLPYLL